MKLQKLVTSFLLFSLVVGLVGCSKETVVEEEPATAVAVLPASRGQLVCWERVSGKAGAQEEVYIVPQLGGEITAVEVKTGDRVEKGQVLVRLDNTDLMLQVKRGGAADGPGWTGPWRASEERFDPAGGGGGRPKRGKAACEPLFCSGRVSRYQQLAR